MIDEIVISAFRLNLLRILSLEWNDLCQIFIPMAAIDFRVLACIQYTMALLNDLYALCVPR